MDCELRQCLNELRSLCEQLDPPPSRWQKIQERCLHWWFVSGCGSPLETITAKKLPALSNPFRQEGRLLGNEVVIRESAKLFYDYAR